MSNFLMKFKTLTFMNRLSRRKRAWVCLIYYRSRRSIVVKFQLHDTEPPPKLFPETGEHSRCYFEREFRWSEPTSRFEDPTSSISRTARKERLFHLVANRRDPNVSAVFYNGFDLLVVPPGSRKLDRAA